MRVLAAGLTILLLVLQYDLWFSDGGLRAAWQLEREITRQQTENAQLKDRNAIMQAEVDDLRKVSDKRQKQLDAYEERARSELGMIKHNETFIQVVD